MSLPILAIMVILIIYPEVYLPAVIEGLKIWLFCVVPSLFPFFFLTAFLTKLGAAQKISGAFDKITLKMFNCRGISAYVFLISAMSGYPVGARLISDLYKEKQLTSAECTRMSAFCSTSGPLFIIGSIGTGMLLDKSLGLIIFISHILSAILCGFIFKGYKSRPAANAAPLERGTDTSRAPRFTPNETGTKSADNILGESVYSSVISILCVGGFISLFYTFSEMLVSFKIFTPLTYLFYLISGDKHILNTLLQGIVEMSRGCILLSQTLPAKTAACFISALISFGGLSVNLQAASYLKNCGSDIKIYFLSKTLQAVICFILCSVIISFF